MSAPAHIAPTSQPLRASDGVRLCIHRLGDAGGSPLLLVPGTFSNHRFWIGTRGVGFARALADSGFDTWTLDPRGHGDSDREPAPRTWRFDDWARRDVPAALRAALAATGDDDRRAFVVGHSAGGAAALVALATEPALAARVAGLIVIGTPLPWLQPFHRLGARAIRALSALLGRFPARALRIGPEDEPAGVLMQWMTWNLDGQWLGDDGTDYTRALGRLTTPLVVIAGAGDRRWAPPRACHALLGMVASSDRSFVLCGRETGFSRDFGHVDMVTGRAARAEIWPRMIEWLLDRNG